jgi:hypothetical protein
MNFAYRTECNRCHVPRSNAAGGVVSQTADSKYTKYVLLIKPSGINSFLFIKIEVAHQVSLKMTEEQRVVEVVLGKLVKAKLLIKR